MRTSNVPGVYIPEVIDNSSITVDTDTSTRSIFVVIVSDRGPDNQIKYIYSSDMFQKLYGKPNLQRYGHGHYFVMDAIVNNAGAYVIRASLIDSENEIKNATIANAIVRFDNPDGSYDITYEPYIFTNKTDALNKFNDDFISKFVFTNDYGFNSYAIGDYIYSYSDEHTEYRKVVARGNIPNIDGTPGTIFYLVLDSVYMGNSTVDQDNNNDLLVNIINIDKPTDLSSYIIKITNKYAKNSNAKKYFPGVEPIKNSSFRFTNGKNTIIATDSESYDSVNIGEWIFPSSLDSSAAIQIVDKEIDTTGQYSISTNSLYTGITSTAPETIKSYTPLKIIKIRMKNYNDVDELDNDNIWTFHAKGCGSYYNKLFIKGNRNTYNELRWADENLNPTIKYVFMDIEICQRNDDGSYTVLEGPWEVSLLNSKPGSSATSYSSGNSLSSMVDDTIIRDNTGMQMYIEHVINMNSDLITCKEANGINAITGDDPISEQRRLQIISLFSENNVIGTTTVGSDGISLTNGSDGALFDKYKNLNIYDGEITGSIARAYEGVLPSRDGSIANLMSIGYQKFDVDYVVAGGYSAMIQQFANELTLNRQDMLLLADTGANYNKASLDIFARLNYVPWSNYNAMIYTQYRYSFDEYTGKFQWFSPVTDALRAHLRTDNQLGVSEPVANIDKGAVQRAIKLAYEPCNTKINNELDSLIANQLNPTITDNGGIYLIHQLTTLKRLSVLTRGHVVKSLHKIRKEIPPALKPFIQLKMNKIHYAKMEDVVMQILSKYAATSGRNEMLTSYSCKIDPDEKSSTVNVSITVTFVKAIEIINIIIFVG